MAFATIYRASFQIASQRIGNHFAHAQRRAAGRIDFVAMVRFNDFDVIAVVQHARHRVQNMEGQVHAHAVIGGEHHGVFLRRRRNGCFAVVVIPGCADDHFDVFFRAFGDERQGSVRPREVNDHIAVGQHGIDVGGNRHTGFLADSIARVQTQGIGACVFQRARQYGAGVLLHRLYQYFAHTAVRAGHGNSDLLRHYWLPCWLCWICWRAKSSASPSMRFTVPSAPK